MQNLSVAAGAHAFRGVSPTAWDLYALLQQTSDDVEGVADPTNSYLAQALQLRAVRSLQVLKNQLIAAGLIALQWCPRRRRLVCRVHAVRVTRDATRSRDDPREEMGRGWSNNHGPEVATDSRNHAPSVPAEVTHTGPAVRVHRTAHAAEVEEHAALHNISCDNDLRPITTIAADVVSCTPDPNILRPPSAGAHPPSAGAHPPSAGAHPPSAGAHPVPYIEHARTHAHAALHRIASPVASLSSARAGESAERGSPIPADLTAELLELVCGDVEILQALEDLIGVGVIDVETIRAHLPVARMRLNYLLRKNQLKTTPTNFVRYVIQNRLTFDLVEAKKQARRAHDRRKYEAKREEAVQSNVEQQLAVIGLSGTAKQVLCAINVSRRDRLNPDPYLLLVRTLHKVSRAAFDDACRELNACGATHGALDYIQKGAVA